MNWKKQIYSGAVVGSIILLSSLPIFNVANAFTDTIAGEDSGADTGLSEHSNEHTPYKIGLQHSPELLTPPSGITQISKTIIVETIVVDAHKQNKQLFDIIDNIRAPPIN